MDTLQAKLAELAEDAPSGGAPASELWARGKRSQRRRYAAVAAGPLAAVWLVPRGAGSPEVVGLVAETGEFGTLPIVLDDLRTLSPRQRAVLVLRYFDDLTEAETAAALGVSVGTVKSHAHDALERLRKQHSGEERPAATASNPSTRAQW